MSRLLPAITFALLPALCPAAGWTILFDGWNGRLVGRRPGDPKRSKTGPVTLRLHDQCSVMMLRNIRLREAGNP